MLANHCRTLLLLEKEYFKLKKNPLWGIEVEPLEDREDFFHWEAIIKGPKDTIWDGGRFKIYLTFNEGYSGQAPEVFFRTIPFHPNVDMQTGKPCVDFLLDDSDVSGWKDYYDVRFILLNLQTMLAFPVLENPVNQDAARLCKSRPKQYKQTVLDCVYASKRFEDGIAPDLLNVRSPHEQAHEQPIEVSRSSQKPTAKISFEDYHKIWASIATSRSTPLVGNHVDDEVDFDIQNDHYGFIESELEDELRKQMAEHNAVMYGKFCRKSSRAERKISELKATKVQLLKQLYIGKQDMLDITTPPTSSQKSRHQNEPSDKEVDDLVHWTENLPDHFE